jgi:hypothetical protein
LEELIKNGTFEKIFQRANQDAIKNANLKSRTVITLRNSFLSPEKCLYIDPAYGSGHELQNGYRSCAGVSLAKLRRF